MTRCDGLASACYSNLNLFLSGSGQTQGTQLEFGCSQFRLLSAANIPRTKSAIITTPVLNQSCFFMVTQNFITARSIGPFEQGLAFLSRA
jgi:hypothetical protein